MLLNKVIGLACIHAHFPGCLQYSDFENLVRLTFCSGLNTSLAFDPGKGQILTRLQHFSHPRTGGLPGLKLRELGFVAEDKWQGNVAEFLDQEGRHLQGGLQPCGVDGLAGRGRCRR